MVRQVGEPEFVFERAAGKEGSSVEFLADEKKKILEQQNNMIFDAAEYQERSEAGESLLMRKGVIVRHLVMPDCVETETLEQVLQQSLFHLLHDSRDSASSAEGNGPGTVLQGLLLIPP